MDSTFTGANYSNRTLGTPGAAVYSSSAADESALHVEKPIGMNLMVMSQMGELRSMFLQYPPAGRCTFGADIPVVVEAEGNSWIARAAARASFCDPLGKSVAQICLEGRRLYPLETEEEEYILYTEEVNEDSYAFHNYIVLAGASIRIGRLDDNDIIYPGEMISRHHATLTCQNRVWRIEDNRSANGVYVNGYKIDNQVLHTGDVVHIMGLRLIIGSGFVAINDGNNRVRINQDLLRRVDSTDSVLQIHMADPKRKWESLFNPQPRRRLAMEEKEIALDNPPMSMDGDRIPMIMRMGGSMVMSGSAMIAGNMAMMVSSLLLPVLSQRYTKEEREEYQKRREEVYNAYLDEKEQEIDTRKEEEERILNFNYPPLAEVIASAQKREKLWERSRKDDDFLQLRVGCGSLPLSATLRYAERKFDMDDDELRDAMYELAEREVMLEDVPIRLDLLQNHVCGITGSHDREIAFAKAMLMRISMLYSYDEVKLVLLADEQDLSQLEMVRFLPHAWDDQKTIRFVATTASEAYQIGEHLEKSLGTDLEKPGKPEEVVKRHPYYIVFALSRKLLDGMEVVKKAISHESTCGITVLALFSDVPKECTVLVNLGEDNEENTINYLKDLDRKDDHFICDPYRPEEGIKGLHMVANTSLKLVSQAFDLPKMLTFLEMYGVGRLEHMNIAKTWAENDPIKTLAVPIGIATDGTLFTLDLHQKFQGPHGLVAGTTGSGKSEFLLTYILSLALNFHPDEVSFLLIDYKGGGLAGAFDDPANNIHLPHLVGTITNLDGAAINRSLISIQSETMRRQRVFNEAKSATGEGTMDIYTYQRLYRNGRVSEPMPHLFIISDEFAELKQQQPEFLDQLVSIARIGRSLGVHLILATQKPSGVVTDQIVSNTKFRVCLKVADKGDSMDMLKRPDAADLRETGRFYLQVGNNEFFALGQSAWCGAEYEPQDEVVVKRDDSVQVVDLVGADIYEAKPDVKKQTSGRSQLVALVRAITDLANEMNIKPRSLWLPPLRDKIPLSELDACYGTNPEAEKGIFSYIGWLDDPENQKQYPLMLDIVKSGHILITGESGMGKTTFIQSLLYSLASRYTSGQVNFYILDFSARLMRIFRQLPHTGAVLTEENEDQIDSFFKLINDIVQERKAIFSELEVDNYDDANRARPMPLIIVVIDNLSGLFDSKPGFKLREALQGYLKSSLGYGIRYVVSISHPNDASMRIRQEMAGRITLKQKDKYDFTDMLGVRCTYLPPELPGRGLYVYDERPVEMQLAMYEPEKDNRERLEDLRADFTAFSEKNGDAPPARSLRMIAPEQEYADFAGMFRTGRIPLGYALKTSQPVALPLRQFSQMSLYFGNPASPLPVWNNILTAAKRENMAVVFARRIKNSVLGQLDAPEDIHTFEMNKEGVEDFFGLMVGNVAHRYEIFKEYCEAHEEDPNNTNCSAEAFAYMRAQTRPIMVIIESFADLVHMSTEMEGLLSQFSSVCLLAGCCNMYLFSGFYRGDPGFVWGNDLYKCYNPDKLALLFGGMLKDQSIASVPYNWPQYEKPDLPNGCVVQYRDALYPLLMPCGVVESAKADEDEAPIFEGE